MIGAVITLYPTSLTKTIGIDEARVGDIEYVLLIQYPNSVREFSSYNLVDMSEIESVLSTFSNLKVRRSYFRPGPTSDEQFGYYMFIKFKDEIEKKDIAIDVFTSNRLSINGKKFIIYGDGISPKLITDLISRD